MKALQQKQMSHRNRSRVWQKTQRAAMIAGGGEEIAFAQSFESTELESTL
jgi:hypothetical protein